MDHGSVDQWISERCMYVTPIRLDLLLNTNQISCYKGKWYERRFDPDTVENGHIYSSVKEEEVFIYWVYLDCFVLVACKYLTIILRNRAEYRLILSRRGRRPSRLKSDDIPRD